MEQAWYGPQTEVAAEVKEISAPHVQRLESGSVRLDYESLAKHRKELLAFHSQLRSEYEARIALDEDEEEVMLLSWN